MVNVIQNGSDTEIAKFSVIQQSEEYTSEKSLRNTVICDCEVDMGLIDIGVEGIKLRRDAFHFSKFVITSSDRIGDGSPPFVGSSTVDKYDQVSPPAVMINLPAGYILAPRIEHDHIHVLHMHKRALTKTTWFG